MQTRLIVPIASQEQGAASQQIKAAVAAGGEMLELRVDYLKNLNSALVEGLIWETRKAAGQAVAIVVTCRDKRQGGARNYQEQLRIEVLISALRAGAEFIDFEYENFLSPGNRERILLALSENPKARLILSGHNFERRFDDIGKFYSGILAAHEEAVPKLVYTASHINDCFEAFDLLHNTSGKRIVFCMGEAGLISRILAKKLGSFYTFASIDDKTATAPGQLTIEQFKKLYRFDCINADTEVYGVIGSPIAHSLSPAIHNGAFADAGLNKLYVPLLVGGGKQDFDRFMDNILAREWLGFRGLSITLPHKQNALEYVRQNGGFIEPLAERIGAVNTVLIATDGTVSAYNTDYAGALDAIASALGIARTDLKDLPVALIGAGGVARAIVAGLSDAGAAITIYNRTIERGERLASEFGCSFAPLTEVSQVDARLLINCTSIGMHPNVDATPVPKEYIKKDVVVFDTVYNPVETLLLGQARETGARTIDGLSMFVNQACAQFRLFTGQEACVEVVRKTISNYLSRN